MPVDPHIQGMLDAIVALAAPPLNQGTPQAAREGFLMMTTGMRTPETTVPVGATEDRTVPGPAGPMKARVYRPDRPGPLPTVAFFHGGGWVIGDIETHDNQARSICAKTDAVVVSVDYRLAPETRFPGAVEDCVAATRWAAEHVGELGGDADRLAVAGDSAGGNLAAVVAQQARDGGGPKLAAQLLIYPAVDAAGDYPSTTENAEGYLLTRADMDWFGAHYAADETLAKDPRLSPYRADSLAGLPPAVIVTAEFDPLRDEGEAYGERLREAGVPVTVTRFDGMVHGFFDMGPLSPGAQRAVDETCAAFRALLHG